MAGIPAPLLPVGFLDAFPKTYSPYFRRVVELGYRLIRAWPFECRMKNAECRMSCSEFRSRYSAFCDLHFTFETAGRRLWVIVNCWLAVRIRFRVSTRIAQR